MSSAFVLQRATNEEFYFILRADNNETVLTSETYRAKASAENGIAAVKTNAPLDERYVCKVAANDQHYFVLRAANNEPVGTSQQYSSREAMEAGITAVKRIAATAPIVDQT